MLDEKDKYEPEAIEALYQTIQEKNITEEDLESARKQILQLKEEKDQTKLGKIQLTLSENFSDFKKLVQKIKNIPPKYAFWVFFIPNALLILRNLTGELYQFVVFHDYMEYNKMLYYENPWSEKVFLFMKISTMPISAILLGLRKKLGWTLMMIGWVFIIPFMLFEIYSYYNMPNYGILRIFLPVPNIYELILPTIAYALIIYAFSAKKMREYLNLQRNDFIIAFLIGGILVISPWWMEILSVFDK